MSATFIRRLRLDGFLSFAPGTEPFELRSLNVLIGPNGSGKTNVIEAMELLRATPTDLAAATLAGGEPLEWQWKGDAPLPPAIVEAELDHCSATGAARCATGWSSRQRKTDFKCATKRSRRLQPVKAIKTYHSITASNTASR